MGIVRKALATALCVASVAAASPVSATAGHLAKRDAVGDVKINRNFDGLSLRQRKSIDIRRVTVNDGATSTRLTVYVSRLVKTDAFVQKFYIAAETSVANTYASYVFYPQAKTKTLIYNQFGGGAGDFAQCNEVQPTTRWTKGKVFIDIPHECVPNPAADLHVYTYTAPRPGARRVWSSDNVMLHGKMRG